MLGVHIENIGDMAVIECEGRIVRGEAASKLRAAVNSQRDARIIVLDLSEVPAVEGGGLGMLVFLQQWTHDHGIRLICSIPATLCATGWNTLARFGSSTLPRSTK